MLAPKQKKKIRDKLETLWQSCDEGFTGEWETATYEGRKGFTAMQEVVEEIAQELGIRLPTSVKS